MSNQTPDRSHASGTFVPVVEAPFTTSIVNSKAINSFVRNSAGNYTVGLTNGLAFAEGNAEAALPANFLGIAGATIAPDGTSVLVTVFDLSGTPVDPPTFGLEVRSIEEGEGQGPQPALPGPPTPAGFLGWARVTGDGNTIREQSTSAPLLSYVRNSTGNYTYTLQEGLDNQTLHVQAETGGAFGIAFDSNPPEAGAIFTDDAGALADVDHAVFFFTF